MKNLISKLVLFTFLIVYVSLILKSNLKASYYSFKIIATFIVIGLFAFIEILIDKRNYSLIKIHWYFIFIFMFLAPFCQYLSGYDEWGYSTSETSKFNANLIVILWCAIFSLGSRINLHLRSKKNTISKENLNTIVLDDGRKWLLFLTSLIAFAILIALVGVRNLVSTKEFNTISGSTWSILINLLLRSIPVISLCIFLVDKKQNNHKNNLFIIVLLIITIFSNFPSSLSRYWILPIYLGLILSFFSVSFFKNRRFDLFVIFGLCVLFPFMTIFKRMTLNEVLANGFQMDLSEIFNNVDFDAHSILCRTLDYCNSNGFSYGRQLISVIFFFVPKSFLSIKGTPSGELIAIAQGSYFTNISCPIMAEGYIDFGFFGVILYSFILSRILVSFDNYYWDYIENGTSRGVSYISVIYLFLLGFLIYLLRGALQPTFLRVMGFYLFLIIVYVLDNVILKRKALKK